MAPWKIQRYVELHVDGVCVCISSGLTLSWDRNGIAGLFMGLEVRGIVRDKYEMRCGRARSEID